MVSCSWRTLIKADFGYALRARGFNGDLAAHVMPWFGDGVHIHKLTRYVSNNPDTIARQLQTMQEVGISCVLETFQGLTSAFGLSTALETAKQCDQRGMKFAVVLDPWAVKDSKSNVVPDPAGALITLFQNPDVMAMLMRSSYLQIDGGAAILSFLSGISVDWTRVAKSIPVPVNVLDRHSGYSWPEITPGCTPASVIATLKADNAKTSMRIPGLCLRFNDGGLPTPPEVSLSKFSGTRDNNSSVWGGASRTQYPEAGNFFFDQLDVTPIHCPVASLVTWNDADEESSDLETFASFVTGRRIF